MLPFAAAGALDPKIIKTGLIVLAVGGGGYLLYRAYHQANQDNAQAALDNSPEAQQANNLLKMIHPKTYQKISLLNSVFDPIANVKAILDEFSSVDKKAIVEAAKGIKSFDLVSKYYSDLTKNSINLADDIRSLLSTTQQKEFYFNISVNTNKKESAVEKAFYIVATPTATNKTTVVCSDPLLKKPIIQYLPNTKMGLVTKLITSPYLGKDGVVIPLQLYYFKMESGKYTGQLGYAMVSQVSKVKAK